MPSPSTGDRGEVALRGCRIVHTTCRGRCVVAAQPLKAGTLLLRERAVCGVDSTCLRGMSDMFPALDRSEWLLVQLLRDQRNLIADEGDEQSPLLLGVLALRLIRASRVVSAPAAATLRSLCTLAAPLSPVLTALSSVLVSVLLRLDPPLQQKPFSALTEECQRVVGSLSCNLFTITDTELLPCGVALFPTATLFNHSCTPSACQVFPRAGAADAPAQRIIEVRAIRDVQRGEELCVSYIDSAQPRQERQSALLQMYRFCCSCYKCCVADSRDAWRCCSAQCRGLYGPTPALERIRYDTWLLSSSPPVVNATATAGAIAVKVPVAARTVLVHSSAAFIKSTGYDLPCPVPSLLSQQTEEEAEAQLHCSAAAPAWPDSQLAWLFVNFRSSRRTGRRATLDASWRELAGGRALRCEVCGDTQSMLWVIKARRALLAAIPNSSSAGPAVEQRLSAFRMLQHRVLRTHYLTFDWGTKLCLALIYAQRFEEALSVCAVVLDTLPCLYPGAHPVALVQRYQACKLLRLLGRASLPQAVPGTAKYGAEDLLRRAAEAARTLYGDVASCTENVAERVMYMTM